MNQRAANPKCVARVHRQVRGALEQVGLAPGKLLVLAVSGGPDSLTLLHALHHLQDDLDLRLHGAHLDHGLRGEASRADARYVADAFARLGIGLTLEEADVAGYRQTHRLSVEEAARKVRYAFLARVAAEQRADAVCLGHTADDQAETVLMHIIRGTGLTGLRGMEAAARSSINGAEVVLARPLLHITRRQTEEYCSALNLEPRRDESNLSVDLKRNRVRAELLPTLQDYNPRIREALIRLSHSAALDMDFIEEEVERQWGVVARLDDGLVSLDRGAFSQLPQSVQMHLLRRAFLAVKGDLEDMEQYHIEEMGRLMSSSAGRSLDLPGGLRFAVGYSDATLAPSALDLCPLPVLQGEHWLQVPGETLLAGWRVTADVVDRGPAHHASDTDRTVAQSYATHAAYLDHDHLGGELRVRSRLPGDRFQPTGMAQGKRLQDFMVDAKIPRTWRDRVPLVVSSRGIAWVVGWRTAEWARARDEDPQRLELTFVAR